MECLFCNIIRGKEKSFKVWENRDFILLLLPEQINIGHVILIPKKHTDYIFNVKEPLYSQIFRTAKKVSLVLKRITSAERIGLAIEGFGIRHVHIHLVPVNKGNELNPLKAKKVPEKQLQQMQIEFSRQFKELK